MINKSSIFLSNSAILKIILIVAAIFFVYLTWDILILFFAALIFAIALDRPIDKLETYKIPRVLAAILVYFVILAAFVFILYLIIPSLASQIKGIITEYAPYLENIGRWEGLVKWQSKIGQFDFKQSTEAAMNALEASGRTVFGIVTALFGGLFSAVVIFFLALFLNIQEKGVKQFVFYLAPQEKREYLLEVFDRIQKKVSNWLWSRVASSVGVALLIFLGLYLLGIKYSLALGVLAFVLNFVIYIGPMIAALPAVIFALSQSLILALAVVGLYFVVNSVIETFIFTPLLMKKAANINPALLILVVLIGARLAGILGIIIAIPTAAIIAVVGDEYIQSRKRIIAEKSITH